MNCLDLRRRKGCKTMTEKLFYQDSHMSTFTAKVESCMPLKEGYQIVLDRTAFFPEGGGQGADTGLLSSVRVLDVQEKDGIIFHFTDAPLEIGQEVEGRIDWKKRFSKMQQHTGEHIVSGIVHSRFGYNNVGFHLGEDNVTLDFNGVLTKEELREVEYAANEAVAANVDILVSYPDDKELETLEYRSKIEIEGQTRIVTIPGYDVCACCAPHVRKTGEIGIIKLVQMQNYKGGVRITMKCGFRALEDYNKKETTVKALSALLSAKEDELTDFVERLKEEIFELKGEIFGLNQKIFQSKVEKLEDGCDKVIFFEDTDAVGMRNLMNLALEKKGKMCAVFSGKDGEYKYVIGSKEKDVRQIANVLNETFQGRGGGKPDMVQGSLKGTKEQIEKMWENL